MVHFYELWQIQVMQNSKTLCSNRIINIFLSAGDLIWAMLLFILLVLRKEYLIFPLKEKMSFTIPNNCL